MRLPKLLLLAVLLAIAACSDVAPAVPSARDDNASVQEDFVRRLKTIADGDMLFEPDRVADALGVPLTATVAPDQVPQPPRCDSSLRSFVATSYAPPARWWFGTRPQAPGKLELPGFMINQAANSGDPAFEYTNRHAISCDDRYGLLEHRTATLSFDGLPSFVCLTPARLQQLLPGSQVDQATDGVAFVHYAAPAGVESGARLTFTFRIGTACALAASADQDLQGGLRYQRAHVAYETCRMAADRTFCAAHGPVALTDNDAIDAMFDHSRQVCGSENARYLAEPATTETPGPLPRRFGPPCEFRDHL